MKLTKRILSLLLALTMVLGLLPVHAFAAEADATLTASLSKAKTYIDGITINNSSNDPATVVKNFKTHFTWDNEKRENSKSYLFDWSYYNGVVFEGIEYVYEVTGESVYKDYVVEYMSSLINANGGWATCSNNSSKQCAGYNSTHGADCYKTASLLMDAYEMTGDSRYLITAQTLYADLDSAAGQYSLKNAGMNFRHTWASDPSPDLWLDGLYMILPFRAEYAAYIGDQEELDLIVSRMQWVSDNMYNSSRKLFYHAADSATSNSGTYWLRSIGWYAAAIADIMDSMEGSNLETMKVQLKKLVDGMLACQNASNGMWLNNMNASQSSSNPYETSGTALVCYAVMKAVNNGWLDESYADMAILAFNGICREKLSGSTLKDICFKGVPSGSNSTFYDNEGKGVGPFIMLYAEILEYVNKPEEEPEVTEPEVTEPEVTEPVVTEPEVTEPEVTEPEVTEPEVTEPEEEEITYTGTGALEGYEEALGAAATSISSGTSYYLVNTKANKTLTGTANGNRLQMNGTQSLDNANRWYITKVSSSSYYVQFGGPSGSYLTVGNDTAALSSSPTALTLTYDSTNKCWDIGSGNYHLNDYRAEHNYASGYTADASSDNGSRWAFYPIVAAAPKYVLDTDGIDSGEKYIIVYSGKALQNNNGVDANPAVTISNNTITPSDDATLAWTITQASGSNYYVENNGSYLNLTASGDDPIGNKATVNITGTSTYKFRNASGSGAYLRYSSSQLFCAGTSSSNNSMNLYRREGGTVTQQVVFTLTTSSGVIKPGTTLALNGTVTLDGKTAALSSCTIAWESSDEACATVSNGIVTAVSGGSATITAALSAVNGTALKSPIILTVPVTVQGHLYESVVTAPTCTEAGYTTYTCSICGDSYVADEIAALGHSYTGKTTEPTCTEGGSVVYTCICGDTYTEVIPAKGHAYSAVVTAPTCTDEGYTTYTCACGDTYVADEIAALGHSYTGKTTEPTCTADGSVVYTCACGDTYTEVIPAKGHAYNVVVTAPTCTDGGYTTHTCSGCGDTYITDETSALGHSYTSKTTEATCTADGAVVYTCACGDTYTVIIPAKGHTYRAVVTVPTCTVDGYTTYTCSTCGDAYVAGEVDALGHDNESVVTEATCTEAGFTTHTCRRCGEIQVGEHVAALGHDYKTVIVEPTCTADGSRTRSCLRCGDSSTEILSALGHSYESVTVAATCTTAGSVTYTCHCGDTYTEVIPALGHRYDAVVTAPTCVTGGYTTYTCICGDSYVADEVAALGHKYDAVVTAPTCVTSGYTTYTCACGDSYVADEVAALGHKYDAVVTAPTCVTSGYTTYTCACGDSYVADEIAALGHRYTGKTTEPTCTADGSVVYTCSCGDTYTEVIPAKGHEHEAVVVAPTCETAGYTTYTCACGDTYIDDQIPALGHSYNTVDQNGQLTYTCTLCGHSYTESAKWVTVGSSYVLDTDGIDVGSEHQYIVVGADHDYALTMNGTTVGCAPVTISNNTISVEDDSLYAFYFAHNSSEANTHLLTRDGSRGIYHVSGNINYGHDSKGYWYFGSASNGQYQLYDKDGSIWYLNYGYVWSNQTVSNFAVSSNPRTVRLFKESDNYARLSGQLIQTAADTDNISIDELLSTVFVQLSANGSDVIDTVAVTEDMLDWDTDFDATLVGNYVANVFYQDTLIGSITITITTNHCYETTVVEPTCTEFGYTEYNCTVCGESHRFDYTDPVGHTYTYVDSDGLRVYTCTDCGDSYTEKLASICAQVSTFTSGNRFVIAIKSGGKYYALSHGGNSLTPVQVSVTNGKITTGVTDDLLWSYNNGALSYVNGGTTFYLYTYTSGWWYWSSTNLGISTNTPGAVSFSNNKLKIDSVYLRFSNSSFTVDSAASAVYIFKEQ